MFILMREDGACFASCSPEHAILLAGTLAGLDVAYSYRPKRVKPRLNRTFICSHCGLCGSNCFPDHEVCDLHGFDGIDCPEHDWQATAAYIYGAAAATCYDPEADLDEIEQIVEAGAWAAPETLVYELIQRYRPKA